MSISRRNFIKTAGLSTLAGTAIIQSLSSCGSKANETPFGIQLWTVKENMAKDPIMTLNFLADMGYLQIESFAGEKGIFWGFDPTELKKNLSDLNLNMVSSHINPNFTTDSSLENEFKKLLEGCNIMGINHVFNPYPGPQKSSDDWKNIAAGLNRQGAISKTFGIKSGYHNHHHEFITTPEGDLPYNILLQETDPELVKFELDLYWAVKAGHDPIQILTDNPNRIPFAHFKDLFSANKIAELESKEKAESDEWPIGASTYLGNGQIDFNKILKVGKENGLTHFIVEQERFDDSTPLKDSKKDADYMKILLA